MDGSGDYVIPSPMKELKIQRQPLPNPKVRAARLALSETIKTRILGVRPEDQDVVLEDDDWFHIIAALEGDRP